MYEERTYVRIYIFEYIYIYTTFSEVKEIIKRFLLRRRGTYRTERRYRETGK